MEDYKTTLSHFNNSKLYPFNSYPESDKPINAVSRNVLVSTSPEDAIIVLQELDFDASYSPSPEQFFTIVTLPLFLVTLPEVTNHIRS